MIQYNWRDAAARSRDSNLFQGFDQVAKLIHEGHRSSSVPTKDHGPLKPLLVLAMELVRISDASMQEDPVPAVGSATSLARRSTAAACVTALLSLVTGIEILHYGCVLCRRSPHLVRELLCLLGRHRHVP